jgi:uncharacterized protein (DUF302 family)
MAVSPEAFDVGYRICVRRELVGMGAEGLTTIKSRFGPNDTVNRLESEVKARGMTLFAHIPHAKGAEAVGVPLHPNDLPIFGNAKVGTPLMQSAPTIGIDLPLKVLVWQDADGTTWLSYNDPAWLAKRHRLGPDVVATVKTMTGALHAITTAAAGSE